MTDSSETTIRVIDPTPAEVSALWARQEECARQFEEWVATAEPHDLRSNKHKPYKIFTDGVAFGEGDADTGLTVICDNLPVYMRLTHWGPRECWKSVGIDTPVMGFLHGGRAREKLNEISGGPMRSYRPQDDLIESRHIPEFTIPNARSDPGDPFKLSPRLPTLPETQIADLRICWPPLSELFYSHWPYAAVIEGPQYPVNDRQIGEDYKYPHIAMSVIGPFGGRGPWGHRDLVVSYIAINDIGKVGKSGYITQATFPNGALLEYEFYDTFQFTWSTTTFYRL